MKINMNTNKSSERKYNVKNLKQNLNFKQNVILNLPNITFQFVNVIKLIWHSFDEILLRKMIQVRIVLFIAMRAN